MEGLVAHAPLFFAEGVQAANALAEADPRALAALLARAGAHGAGLPAGAGAALEYLVVGLRRLRVSDARAVGEALQRLTPASAALAAALGAAATAAEGGGGAPAGSSSSSSSSAGVERLLGVDWAVTVPVASSGGAGSGAGAPPGVTLQLRVELPHGGGTATRALLLSVAQLALVEAAFREAALGLERA
jgi:hypothetical protein